MLSVWTRQDQVAGYDGKVTNAPQTNQPAQAATVLLTDQLGPHPDLAEIVLRHQDNPWRKPCPAHTRDAFEQLQKRLKRDNPPLILDSFCGTGMSTALIAVAHPDALVVGIDQSAHRLAKHQPGDAQNYLLLRAEAEPFGFAWWRLASHCTAIGCSIPIPGLRPRSSSDAFTGMVLFPCYPGWVGRWSSAPTGTFTRKSSLKQPASSVSMDKPYPSPPIRQ